MKIRSKGIQFAELVLAFALFGTGVSVLAAGAKSDHPLPPITPQSPTTTMINSLVIEPQTTTTVAPTTTSTIPRPVPRKAVPVMKKAVAAHSAPSTTTTTEAAKTPLEVALSQVGKTGLYAEGGFWCAKAVSYFAEQAKVQGFISRDGPGALYADAVADGRLIQDPVAGGMIFIDLFGPDGIGHGQVTHVGIVEYLDGVTVGIVQGNGQPDPRVITRTTYELGDGYIVGFAPFSKGDK
jgi:hypothetical protein